jgi:hypothetical protein
MSTHANGFGHIVHLDLISLHYPIKYQLSGVLQATNGSRLIDMDNQGSAVSGTPVLDPMGLLGTGSFRLHEKVPVPKHTP